MPGRSRHASDLGSPMHQLAENYHSQEEIYQSVVSADALANPGMTFKNLGGLDLNLIKTDTARKRSKTSVKKSSNNGEDFEEEISEM
jgi:hypothetical protein